MASESPLKGRPLRYPGQSLDEQIDRVLNDKVLIYALLPMVVWVFAAMEWFLQIRRIPRMPGTYAVFAGALSVLGAVRIWRLRRQLKALKLGRDGERVVGQFLEQLRQEGARVFHDIQGDGFNLDHVVIASQGIFVVETKTWSKPKRDSKIRVEEGRILKNGFPISPNPLEQAAAAAGWLSRLLKDSTGKTLLVRGVVVFPGWFVEPMDEITRGAVWVLEPKALPSFIQHEPIRLHDSDVALAAFHLSRYIRNAPAEGLA